MKRIQQSKQPGTLCRAPRTSGRRPLLRGRGGLGMGAARILAGPCCHDRRLLRGRAEWRIRGGGSSPLRQPLCLLSGMARISHRKLVARGGNGGRFQVPHRHASARLAPRGGVRPRGWAERDSCPAANTGRMGGGDPWRRPNAVLFVGRSARKNERHRYSLWAVSHRQMMARASWGPSDALPYLEFDLRRHSESLAACGLGLRCAYQYNISWNSPTTRSWPRANPASGFGAFFGHGFARAERGGRAAAARNWRKKSVARFCDGRCPRHAKRRLASTLTRKKNSIST